MLCWWLNCNWNINQVSECHDSCLFQFGSSEALTLLNWNHSKYGGGNMPSISDFPPAGKMPSGKTWKTRKKIVQEQNKAGNKPINQISESRSEPCQTAGRWKGATCWSASSRNSHLSWSHVGTESLLSCPAPWAQLPKAQRKFRRRNKTWNLEDQGGYVVAGTYHFKTACCYHPTKKMVATYPVPNNNRQDHIFLN